MPWSYWLKDSSPKLNAMQLVFCAAQTSIKSKTTLLEGKFDYSALGIRHSSGMLSVIVDGDFQMIFPFKRVS